jgi:hypothetical protein
MTLIHDKTPSQQGVVVIQKNKVFVFGHRLPRDYEWDLAHATKKETKYIKRCLLVNRWL